MPQSAAISEGRLNSGNMKSSLKPSEKTQGTESEFVTAKSQPQQFPLKAGRQAKCPSDAVSGTIMHKKRLQSHTGFSHHPYQSSHPNNTRLDLNIASRDYLSSFTQRVMSAKLLRLKQLQNQLSEAHHQINELCTENRLLQALQKRQDVALDRYEGTQAQLPQLVRSHQEEVRVLRTKYKNLKQQYRRVTCTLKEREVELQNLKEQHGHLLKLSKDRNLCEREALTKQVTELRMTVDTQANTIQGLNRKVLLETKNFKFQLHQEMQKHKTTQSELQQAYLKLDQLQILLDQAKERSVLPPSMDRAGKISSHRLAGCQKPSRVLNVERDSTFSSHIKKTSKDDDRLVSSTNTGSSSAQVNSSPATSSEKTREFSTSFDSSPSPEHGSNIVNPNDTTLASTFMSDSYQFHKTILQKGGTDFSIDFDSNSKKPTDSSSFLGGLSSDVLDEEYENAVAMLTELSNKHNGNFTDDISSSLASLDLTPAKHLAALANTAFSAKGELQSPSKPSRKKEELFPNTKVLQQKEEDNLPKFVKDSPSRRIGNKKQTRTNLKSGFKDTQNLSKSRSSDDSEVESKEGFIKGQHESTEDVIKNDSHTKNKQGFDKVENSQKVNKNTGEMIEASRKEALLKALKAIDDKTGKGNESDDSDSAIIQITSRKVISTRTFSS